MRWVAGLALMALLCLSMGQTCGIDSGEQGEGGPCTRSRDCVAPLQCVSGTCTSSADAGPGDAGVGDGGPSDASTGSDGG